MDILTGNELTSGAAVYLSASGQWVEDLQQARLFGKDEAEARDAALSASKNTGRIVSLEVETVSLIEGRIVPDRLRERIRATGPTVPHTPGGALWDRQHLDKDGHVSI